MTYLLRPRYKDEVTAVLDSNQMRLLLLFLRVTIVIVSKLRNRNYAAAHILHKCRVLKKKKTRTNNDDNKNPTTTRIVIRRHIESNEHYFALRAYMRFPHLPDTISMIGNRRRVKYT